METFMGILIPFMGTALGSACVYFMKNELNKMIAKKPDDTMHLQEFLQEWKI